MKSANETNDSYEIEPGARWGVFNKNQNNTPQHTYIHAYLRIIYACNACK